MSEIQDKHYEQIKSFIETNGWFIGPEKPESDCKRIDVQNGKYSCCVKAYEKKGNILIQGAESDLKTKLLQVKEAIEKGENIGDMLPFEIERFPEVLKEQIPSIDPVIFQYIKEATICLNAGSNLGCALLLGGASEKAIYLLIDTYKNAIKDEAKRQKFESKTSKKAISKTFSEFKQSFKSSQNKPQGYGWTNELEWKIEQMFQFCRICRNEAGHPHLQLPNLDKEILRSNLGQFIKYVEYLYELIAYYENNEVQL